MTDSWPSFLAASISVLAGAAGAGAAADPPARRGRARRARRAGGEDEGCDGQEAGDSGQGTLRGQGLSSDREGIDSDARLRHVDVRGRPPEPSSTRTGPPCGPPRATRPGAAGDRSPSSHWTARTGGRQEIVRGLLTRRERSAYVRSILLRNRLRSQLRSRSIRGSKSGSSATVARSGAPNETTVTAVPAAAADGRQPGVGDRPPDRVPERRARDVARGPPVDDDRLLAHQHLGRVVEQQRDQAARRRSPRSGRRSRPGR